MINEVDWAEIEASMIDLMNKIKGKIKISETKDVVPYVFLSMDNFESINNIKKIISNVKDIKQYTLLLLIMVFFWIENSFQYWVNTVIYFLIKAKHHDIYDDIKRKFIYSMDDLSNTPLSTKLDFLEYHGYSFTSKIANKDIRNAIAHNNFTIDDKGVLILYKNNKISKKITNEDLWNIINNINKLYEVTIIGMAKSMNINIDILKASLTNKSRTEMQKYFIDFISKFEK